jgi:GNAT superfamily N-acetyltransferase
MPHDRLQEFVIIDYSKQMVILAVLEDEEKEGIVGIGQYAINETTYTADVAFAVRDDYQNRGIGTELLSYLTYLAKKQGLLGFTADVLMDNKSMLRVFEKAGFYMEKRGVEGVYELKMLFWKGLWPMLLRGFLNGTSL